MRALTSEAISRVHLDRFHAYRQRRKNLLRPARRPHRSDPQGSALAVSVEELIGQAATTPAKRGPAPKLQQQIERIQRLPRAKQKFVMEMIDTVLAQQSRG